MNYTDLPEELQAWGKGIEMQFAQALSERALKFQTAEAEAGRAVSITEAVHRVIRRMGLKPEDLQPGRPFRKSTIENLSPKSKEFESEDEADELDGEFEDEAEEDDEDKTAKAKEAPVAGVETFMERVQDISSKAIAFQKAEAEVGRVITITEAVNHVLNS